MNSKEFDQASKIILDVGFKIIESEYNDSAFGSWYITVNSVPAHRIVWEGRDRIIRVEKELNQPIDTDPIWETVLTYEAQNEEEFTLAIKQIIGEP